ncbi:MAG: ABC transporter permease [Candidatus Dormibacteraceae bacterium]
MGRAITERLVHTVLSLIAVTILAFGIVRLTGDPVLAILPVDATKQDITRVRAELGLDQPIYVQYGRYMVQLAHGDLGISYLTRTPVIDVIAQRLPATLQLGGAALLLVFGVGIPLGLYAAYWQGGWLDRSVGFGAVLGQSAPQFWVGLLLILVFAVHFRLVPAGGYGGFLFFILPAFTMALASFAGITRLTRSSTIEVMAADYVRFLRVKGLSDQVILWKHALRNAALPVLTLGGVVTADLVTGSVVTETVFAWPGIGQLIINSIHARDFPVIQAVVLVFAVVYLGINLVVDITYIILNPRLRTH